MMDWMDQAIEAAQKAQGPKTEDLSEEEKLEIFTHFEEVLKPALEELNLFQTRLFSSWVVHFQKTGDLSLSEALGVRVGGIQKPVWIFLQAAFEHIPEFLEAIHWLLFDWEIVESHFSEKP